MNETLTIADLVYEPAKILFEQGPRVVAAVQHFVPAIEATLLPDPVDDFVIEVTDPQGDGAEAVHLLGSHDSKGPMLMFRRFVRGTEMGTSGGMAIEEMAVLVALFFRPGMAAEIEEKVFADAF